SFDAHVIQADLSNDSLGKMLPTVDLVTSIGGGFSKQVSPRETALELSGDVRNVLSPGGHLIVTGLTDALIRPSEFRGFKPLNYSIPENFIRDQFPRQMPVLVRSELRFAGKISGSDGPWRSADRLPPRQSE